MHVDITQDAVAQIVAEKLMSDAAFRSFVAAHMVGALRQNPAVQTGLVKEIAHAYVTAGVFTSGIGKAEVQREIKAILQKEIRDLVGGLLGGSLRTAIAKVADRITLNVIEGLSTEG
jgi:hypothetical protein